MLVIQLHASLKKVQISFIFLFRCIILFGAHFLARLIFPEFELKQKVYDSKAKKFKNVWKSINVNVSSRIISTLHENEQN